jgi:hypothetical protein
VVDLSPAGGPDGIKPEDLTTPDAYYGMNGGLDALLGVARPAMASRRPSRCRR